MTSVAVAIMAKAPRPGAVKTRLCPPLSPAGAAELYRCFLCDKIDQVRALRRIRPALAYTPGEARPVFETLAPDFTLVAQRGPDLGARLMDVLDRLLALGHPAAVAVDSDTPTLPTAYAQQAVDRLVASAADVVLGPTEDGGYYLIGVRRSHPALFLDMPWSTPAVLAETLRRSKAAGLNVVCLDPWFDVDTPADLARLRAEVASGNGSGAARTSEFLLRDLRRPACATELQQ